MLQHRAIQGDTESAYEGVWYIEGLLLLWSNKLSDFSSLYSCLDFGILYASPRSSSRVRRSLLAVGTSYLLLGHIKGTSST